MKTIKFIAVAAIGIFLFVLFIHYRAPKDIKAPITPPAAVVYDEKWFKETAVQLVNLDENVTVDENALKGFELNTGPINKTEETQLQEIVDSAKSDYNKVAQDYNFHANEADRSIFKDGLPTYFRLK